MKYLFILGVISGLLFFSSCTKISKEDQTYVSSTVEGRLGKVVHWNQGEAIHEQISCRIHELIQSELTVDAAVQIALFNNPQIQSTFEELGISQADLVEAGLFSNPVFDVLVRYPVKKKFVTDIEYTIAESFIDLFLIPLRKKVAKAELEKTKLRVTNEILDLAFEVEQTYYELQAAEQELQYAESIVEIVDLQWEIAFRQHKINNINRLDFQQKNLSFLEAQLAIPRIQDKIISFKEKLNRLLGFCEEVQWTISKDFPEIDYQGLPLERLEAVAFRERLDLQAARFEVLRLSRKLGIEQWWVYTDGRIGIAGERDADGLNTLGPAFTGEIPIFNYGQAARLRLQAELRQAQDNLSALEVRVLSEVREAHRLLMNHLSVIEEYQEHILPLQREVLESSEELYNVMGLGIDKLLENKLEQLQACSDYVLSLRNYWTARVQLDRVLGGKLYKIVSSENERDRDEGIEDEVQ